MHVFVLILSIMGQPERIAAICETYKECSDIGAAAQSMYCEQFHREPKDFSYRVENAIAVKMTDDGIST